MRTWDTDLDAVPADDDGPDPRMAAAIERLEPEALPRTLPGRVADYIMLAAVVAAPLYGKGIGGNLTGLKYADMVLGLAGLARGVHLATAPVKSVRRYSFLLGMMGLFAGLGVISGFANGTNPLAWAFIRVLIGSLGSVFLVATYGDQGPRARRELVTAFAWGCIILSLTSFTGLKLQGRALGWSVHPNALGHSVMMGLFAAVWLWDNANRPLHRWFWAGAIFLDSIAIMRSGSRGALLGIWVGAMFYFALRGNRRLNLAAIITTWFIIIVLAAGIVHLPATNPLSRLLSQGQSNSTGALSNQARSDLLKSDMARIDASPFFGDGWSDIVNVHVAYLQGWVAAGAAASLVTMIIGLAMLILPLLTRRRDLALACGASAIAVAWVFTNIFTARDQWLFIAIAFGSAQSVTVLGPRRRETLASLDAEP
jgi:hypothetical protein